MSTQARTLAITTPVLAESERSAAARFTALYEEHFDFVWRVVRYLGAAEAQRDDAVQDVFVVAHRRFADFDARSSPRTWLFAIALRVVRDHRRSQRRRFRLSTALGDAPTNSPKTPFETMAHAQRVALVLEALEALSEDQRAMFVLAELEQMNAAEISRALDVNVNTVYSRLRAARRKFAERVGGRGE